MISDEFVEVEGLAACGLTHAAIAAMLGLKASDLEDVITGFQKSDTVDRYRQDCMSRALADPYPEEAAEYLYVRGVSRKTIARAGLIRHRYEFGDTAKEKKTRYQTRQLELARARLEAARRS